MFSNSDKDLTRTLALMIDRSIDECNYNQSAAVKKTAQWIAQDRRFDGYDPNTVAQRAFRARDHGAKFELNEAVRIETVPPYYSGS